MSAPPEKLPVSHPRPNRCAPLPDGALRVYAPAKINLNLLVGARRPDGFHPIDSYVVKISLYDELDLSPLPDGRIELCSRGVSCGPHEQNLALRAARLLAERAERGKGARIVLRKRIAPGKGLGGGSSDAAAVLAGLNRLWDLRLPPRRLIELAAELGSDVPLFLAPAAARMRGRGEALDPVAVAAMHVLLCVPDFSCDTPRVYGAFDDSGVPPGGREQLPSSLLCKPPSQWRARLRNDLFAPAATIRPELADWHRLLSHSSDVSVCMTGSGSALFILCDDLIEARRLMKTIPALIASRCRLATVNPW